MLSPFSSGLSKCSHTALFDYANFARDYIVNQRLAQFLELVDLAVEGGDDAVDVGGFFVEVGGDGLLF